MSSAINHRKRSHRSYSAHKNVVGAVYSKTPMKYIAPPSINPISALQRIMQMMRRSKEAR